MADGALHGSVDKMAGSSANDGETPGPGSSSALAIVGALSLPDYYNRRENSTKSTSTVAASPPAAAPRTLTAKDIMISRRRKELFGDCELIEIIHLHDCLRGALQALQEDVAALSQQVIQDNMSTESANHNSITQEDVNEWGELEGRVAGRFKVIWSVFRAHSSAEDEFIWPALRSKMQTQSTNSNATCEDASKASGNSSKAQQASQQTKPKKSCGCGSVIVQEEYEEDHADEERMFAEMDAALKQLRELINEKRRKWHYQCPSRPASTAVVPAAVGKVEDEKADSMVHDISERTRNLCDHLMGHLEKEETQCMPLVVKHLSKAEIHDLVGNIMGRRSADTITQIMTMAVQSLPENERQEMIEYMKQSMRNTFFDRWLLASGWGKTEKDDVCGESSKSATDHKQEDELPSAPASDPSGRVSHAARKRPSEDNLPPESNLKRQATASSPQQITIGAAGSGKAPSIAAPVTIGDSPVVTQKRPVQITSQAELEKLIRAIATNPSLNPQQKNSTIQGLRDSVWKSNQKEKERRDAPDSPPVVRVNAPPQASEALPLLTQQQQQVSPNSATNRDPQQRPRGGLPPAAYYKKTNSGVNLVWKNDGTGVALGDDSVPLFSATELAPTFHDGAAGAVLGCPHYARAAKLRHPQSGRLYTCRLCCDQARELPTFRGGTQDEKLDRYAVSEVMCMVCNTLQPAEDRCINPDCESNGKPFAKYFCRICHLYDDGSRPIFHCPYCNTCRLGLGLGIDFRHCMRCNACVSLDDKEHQCIPQKLQGTCPICHDSLFQSTEPLRGLKCGHVMHMACFTQYRNTSYTCPLCTRSMEDMKDHFAMIDAAIRMQPMPASFLRTFSNIYCKDCARTSQCPYHFIGQKCQACGSYNTRELSRITH